VREAAQYAPAPVRCSPAPPHTYTPYACGAQRALRHDYSWSTGYDHGVVHINHVVAWTANQNGLVIDRLCVCLSPWPLTLEVVPKSLVTWATSVPILVFLGLSVLFYARCTRQTDVRQTDVRQKYRLMPPPIRGGGIIKQKVQRRTCYQP